MEYRTFILFLDSSCLMWLSIKLQQSRQGWKMRSNRFRIRSASLLRGCQISASARRRITYNTSSGLLARRTYKISTGFFRTKDDKLLIASLVKILKIYWKSFSILQNPLYLEDRTDILFAITSIMERICFLPPPSNVKNFGFLDVSD